MQTFVDPSDLSDGGSYVKSRGVYRVNSNPADGEEIMLDSAKVCTPSWSILAL